MYNLAKTDIKNLINQVNKNNALTFTFDSLGGAFVFSNNSLSAFLTKASKEENKTIKYKYKYVITSNSANNNLSCLVQKLNSINVDYQAKIKVKTFKLMDKNTVKKQSKSTSIINDFLKPKTTEKVESIYKLKIIVRSNNQSIIQHLKTLSNSINVYSPFIFDNSKIMIDYNNLVQFLDLSQFQDTKEDLKGITIGKTKTEKSLIVSYQALDRHLKIEGVNGSGKSGALISEAVELINNNKTVVFIDPHNQTAKQIFESVNNLDKVKVLKIKNNNHYLGFNCLINYGSIQERLEHAESVTTAFFAQEIEDRFLTTVDTAKSLITGFIEFNFNYLVHLHSLGITKEEIEQRIKDKQLTINDLVNINNNESLQLLIAKSIIKTMPALASKFLQFNTQFNKVGIEASLARFKEATNTTTGIAFFEGRGFLTDYNTLQGYSILCMLNELSPLNRGVISKLCFTNYFQLHKQNIIKTKTYLIVDESASAKLPNLLEIITESRKFNLHLTLAYQGLNMWNKRDIEAINLIPNSLEFSTNNEPKKLREFKIKSIDYLEPINGVTIDYPKSLRTFEDISTGQTFDTLYTKIQAKSKDINKYFYDFQ